MNVYYIKVERQIKCTMSTTVRQKETNSRYRLNARATGEVPQTCRKIAQARSFFTNDTFRIKSADKQLQVLLNKEINQKRTTTEEIL